MSPRILSFVVLAAVIAFAPPAFAKEKKRPAARRWAAVADYVLKNGSEHPIKAPASRTLGYDSDAVPAKVLRIKLSASKDKKEHSVTATYTPGADGTLAPSELVLGVIYVDETPAGKKIDSYRLRINMDGKIMAVMHTAGIAGETEQKLLAPDSREAVAVYKSESTLHLKTSTLDQLTQ